MKRIFLLAVPMLVLNPLVRADKVLIPESIGLPTADKQAEARNILELRAFDGRLYIGHGDASVNTGPTDVIAWDPETGEFSTEFTVDDEGIYQYNIIDGKLAIPGVDSTEDWDFGNIYVREPDGWVKHRTIPHGLHVFDLVQLEDAWYVGTGCIFYLGKENENAMAFGGIFRSADKGMSWHLAYATPGDESTVYRIRSVVPFKDKLYAFIYAYSGMTLEEIPEAFHAGLGQPYGKGYLVFSPDPIGPADAVVFDGKRWTYRDLIPDKNICSIYPIAFGESLLLSVLSGEYVSMGEGADRSLTERALYRFDGKTAEKLTFAFDGVLDSTVSEDTLFLLATMNDKTVIAATRDLESWDITRIPPCLEKPVCLEMVNDELYLGVADGNIFRAEEIREMTDPAEIDALSPRRFHAVADLPREGLSYWAAITGWENWGTQALLACTVEPGNLVDIHPENISQLILFPPVGRIDPEKPLAVRIDARTYRIKPLKRHDSVECTKDRNGDWCFKAGKTARAEFEPRRHELGKTHRSISGEHAGPVTRAWMADIMIHATGADAAVFIGTEARKNLPVGTIHLEDVFDMTYDNRLVTTELKGADIEAMLRHHFETGEAGLTQAAGFELELHKDPETGKITVIRTTLDPERRYRVALSDYTASHSGEIFGVKLDYRLSDLSWQRAIIEWFDSNRVVPNLETRIRLGE
ncbi:5'-nucleotidase C-terminal domain-containing protein [bacterium]|nr:5'-nucleotidase C-terminal domain-containing protein [candidate division CSSED10-310 bacterium]